MFAVKSIYSNATVMICSIFYRKNTDFLKSVVNMTYMRNYPTFDALYVREYSGYFDGPYTHI